MPGREDAADGFRANREERAGLLRPWSDRRRPDTDSSVTVLLPAYNEASSLGQVVREVEDVLSGAELDYRLLIVDDGSEDGTRQAAIAAARNGRVDVLQHDVRRGPGRALRSGLLAAVGDSDVVVTMDADRSHDPTVIPRMLAELREGRDVAIASRFADGARSSGVPLHRRILSRSANVLLRVASPISGVRDYSSGFRAYRSEILEHAIRVYGRDRVVSEIGGACSAELLLKLAALGGSVSEVPLHLRYDRKESGSGMSFPEGVRRYGAIVRLVDRWSPPFDRDDTWSVLYHSDPGLRQDRLCRALNVVLAAALIVISAPVMLIVALLVKATSRGPVFYKQTRVGMDRRASSESEEADLRRRVDFTGKPFTIYKFRTMYVQDDGEERQVWASPDDPRVTPVGRVLRKFRLDELPQLFNVLEGNMNLVGPRPEQPDIALRLSDEVDGYRYRHRVRPGITGWAQVNFTYDQSVDDVRQKLRYDLEYIYRRTPIQDLKIAARTVPVMLLQRGAW